MKTSRNGCSPIPAPAPMPRSSVQPILLALCGALSGIYLVPYGLFPLYDVSGGRSAVRRLCMRLSDQGYPNIAARAHTISLFMPEWAGGILIGALIGRHSRRLAITGALVFAATFWLTSLVVAIMYGPILNMPREARLGVLLTMIACHSVTFVLLVGCAIVFHWRASRSSDRAFPVEPIASGGQASLDANSRGDAQSLDG